MSIAITLSHEIEALEALQDEWIDLQNRSSAKSMELSWHVIYIWCKHFHDVGELWLLTAREDQRLIGIAPLMNVKNQPGRGFAWQQLEFIGTDTEQEHLDFIIENGYEEHIIPLFIDELYEHRSQWDVINLTAMSETKTIDILQQSDRDWVEVPKKNMVAPYITLPDTEDEWMLSISPNHRGKLRRYRKKLDQQFPDRWSIIQVTQSDELNDTFDHLVRLHQTHWENIGASGTFYYGEFAEYFRELAHSMLENGWLRMYRVDIDEKLYGVYYCYHYYGRAYFHIGGIDRNITKVPLGYVLLHHSITQAISEDLSEFTLMLGEQSYKYSFGCVARTYRTFRLVSSLRVQLQIRVVGELRKVKYKLQEIIPDVSTEEVTED